MFHAIFCATALFWVVAVVQQICYNLFITYYCWKKIWRGVPQFFCRNIKLATKQFPKSKTEEMMLPMQFDLTVDLQYRECDPELRVEHLRATDNTTTVSAARVSNESPVLKNLHHPCGCKCRAASTSTHI